MNQRIRELAEQAEWRFADKATGNFSEHDKRLEKFAELIVRECANVAADHDALDIYEEIREHFGVDKSQGWVCPKCGTDRTKYACPRGNGATTDGSCPMFGVAQ